MIAEIFLVTVSVENSNNYKLLYSHFWSI